MLMHDLRNDHYCVEGNRPFGLPAAGPEVGAWLRDGTTPLVDNP